MYKMMCDVSSLVHALGEEGILKLICTAYYTVGCFALLLSFHFKFINEWSLHGKNLYIKVEKGETEGKKTLSAISKLRGKIDHMTISKKHFAHFYVVGLVVNSVLLICVSCSCCSCVEVHMRRRAHMWKHTYVAPQHMRAFASFCFLLLPFRRTSVNALRVNKPPSTVSP